MEREQIIKALECISRTEDVLCEGCDYRKYDGLACHRIGAKNALSLIKELTEENETLKKAKYIYTTVDYCADDLAEALEENKRLTEENDRLSTALAEYEYKTNIRISEEYVHNEAYEELREENKKLIEEAENYKKIAEYQQSSNMNRGFKIKRLNEEIERVNKENERVKADTVKKMQESIKNRLAETYGDLPHTNCFINAVDQIAKEMLEGNNESIKHN